MIARIFKNKWLMITIVMVVLALIPVVITTFELITTDKPSVVFMEHYHPIIGILYLVYYLVLFVIGFLWLIRKATSLLNLKNEKTKTELLHLKSQVNPHFFFNMLNNLYGLVSTDPKKAQDLILKLSDMMRYSIYEGEKDFVLLEQEVEYLQQFIELHKMRYHKKINVTFESTVKDNYKVMPLLFIILLENTFKHGIENLREHAYVHAQMTTSEGEIFFEVENNFDPEIVEKPGIGLKNLKRRLELVYPKKHSLSFSVNNDIFKVKLSLKPL